MNQNKKIIGIGTDIISIERIQKSIKKYGKNFLDKIFSIDEQNYCNSYKDPTPRFAARFSAKEAVAKSLGCGFGKELSFLDIIIKNNEEGKPNIILSKKTLTLHKNIEILISISHCKEFATATAIALQ